MSFKTKMSWGKENKMNRIFAEDGKTVMLAIDHGYFMGPVTGMENPAEATKNLIPHVDSLMLSPGILNSSIPTTFKGGVVLRSSGGSSITQPDITDELLTLEAKEAVKLNASAMAVSFYLGTKHEHQTIEALTKAINTASVGKLLEEKRELKFLSLASRIAAEFGADIVKTYYCEGFEKLTNAVPKPVVVAGGPKLDSNRAVFDLVYYSIQKGAAGVDLGRNVWKNDYPEIMIQIIKEIVHNNITPDQAEEMFRDLKK
jgi:putative autoinducer-2 (AI-2) aldolase